MFNDTPRCRSAIGFTLVELLVVIAVIALLMSLLLPGLRKAKEAASIAVCATHLDQIHTALHTAMIDRTSGILPTCDWGQTVVSPVPAVGYLEDPLGMDPATLNKYGWTYEVGLCPGITPDTGGDTRREVWYTRTPDGGGGGGSDYLYSGGRSNHPAGADPDNPSDAAELRQAYAAPRFGFAYDKPGGIYYSTERIYSGSISSDDDGNTYRDETYPSEVIYLADIAYNNDTYNSLGRSYAEAYYGFIDPSNHRDTVVQDHKKGASLWPMVGRGSNRVKADGSIEWWNFPVKGRGKGNAKMGGSYLHDYYTYYY